MSVWTEERLAKLFRVGTYLTLHEVGFSLFKIEKRPNTYHLGSFRVKIASILYTHGYFNGFVADLIGGPLPENISFGDITPLNIIDRYQFMWVDKDEYGHCSITVSRLALEYQRDKIVLGIKCKAHCPVPCPYHINKK